MEISLKNSYGHILIIKADNVNIEEDIEERIYHKNKDGKIDLSKGVERDIQTSAIEQFERVLDDLIHYRKKEYDSSNLIENLFEKLPNKVAVELVKKLRNNYEEVFEEDN